MTTQDAIKLLFQFLDYAMKIYTIIGNTPIGSPVDLSRLEIKETFWESLRKAGVSDEQIKSL